MRAMQPNVTKAVWAGKFALAPLGLYLCMMVLSLWWATQYVAARLAYQPQLGEPLLRLFGFALYRPWQALTWNYAYHYYAPRIFTGGMARIGAGSLLALLAAIVYAVWIARRARVATSHGSARFQTNPEIEGGSLTKNEGVVFGLSPGGRYLRYAGDAHVYSVAPSRAGKGVGQVIPTLLTYPGSVVVNDVKGENWKLTAGYRARFSHVLYWNPTDPQSCHFNPLLEIRRGLHEIKDAGNLVSILIDPTGSGRSDFWEREATNFLVAVILHVLHREPTKTLAGVAYFLANPERPVHESLRMMMRSDYGDPDITRFIRSSAQQVAQKFEKELSGVVSTALSVLGVFRDPLLERLMADSDFRVDDLRTLSRPVSLYLVVPPSDARRLTPLLRLLWEQLVRRQLESLEAPGVKHKLLLMLDEFPRLGRLEVLGEAIDLVAGYGLQMYMLCQGANHVIDIWGPNHRFVTNSAIRIYATPNDNLTAREVSEQLGGATNVHQTRTFTGHRLSPWLGHVMISDQESQRALMTAGEVLTMDRRELLILAHAEHPIRARQLRYYQDSQLKRRVVEPPPLVDKNGRQSLRLKARPNPWAVVAAAAVGPAPTVAPASPAAGGAKPLMEVEREAKPDADLDALDVQEEPQLGEPLEESPDPDLPEHVQKRFEETALQTLAQETAIESGYVVPSEGIDLAKLNLAAQEAFGPHRHMHRATGLER
jgi:type IV secretion system protein VirD4